MKHRKKLKSFPLFTSVSSFKIIELLPSRKCRSPGCVKMTEGDNTVADLEENKMTGLHESIPTAK